MPRLPVIYTNLYPYHVTARFNNKESFNVPLDYSFAVYGELMKEGVKKFGIAPHAFMLMINHFHLSISTPDKNISEFLRFFMTKSSKEIGTKANRINHIYGSRNYKTVIDDPLYAAVCLRYIYQNPVKVGLCRRVEDYKWSSISKERNIFSDLCNIEGFDIFNYVPKSKMDYINWLNVGVPNDLDIILERGLKSNHLKLYPCRKTRKRFDIAEYLLRRNSE